MGVNITYMGTKQHLASHVKGVVASSKQGVFLDAFAGMCSVGERISTDRCIWSNDAQRFATTVAQAILTSREGPKSALQLGDILFPAFQEHIATLSPPLQSLLDEEGEYLDQTSLESAIVLYNGLARNLSICPSIISNPFSLFTRLYANTYIGLAQAVEIDALVKACRWGLAEGHLSPDQYRWCVIALGRSLLKVASTTGHFAQFMKPTAGSHKVIRRQRRRSVWETWHQSLDQMNPVASASWRVGNRVFNEDSSSLLTRLAQEDCGPAVIYADPPYTDDQYSRFYHLLETLVLYDEPTLSGLGRYRSNRFTTPFSLKSKVVYAFQQFISSAFKCKADLILSYPSNGLLYETGFTPEYILGMYYNDVKCVSRLEYKHSTMGSSKGAAKESVMEQLYLARYPQ